MSGAECDMTLLVQADFDGELDAAQAASLAEHRASCALCQASWTAFAAARAAVRAEAPYHRASPALRRAIEARIDAASVPAPVRQRARAWWREAASFGVGAALAATLVLIVLPRQRADAPESVVAALVDDHVRSLQPGHLSDVISTDRHTVKPWFDGRLDFAPPVKDLAAQGFPLLGGRLDYLAGHQVAALAYEHGKHLINLFVWPARGGSGPASAERNGYNALRFTAGGMTLWAVSDLERDQLEAFVRDWQAAS